MPSGEEFTVNTNAYITVPNSVYQPANSASSNWIAPYTNENDQVDQPGNYIYQLQFTISGHSDYRCLYLPLQVADDNELTLITINGETGYSCSTNCPAFSGFTTINVNGTFTSSTNTLQLTVLNGATAPNPTALIVQTSGMAGCTCPAGQFNVGTSSCYTCPAGKYNTGSAGGCYPVLSGKTELN